MSGIRRNTAAMLTVIIAGSIIGAWAAMVLWGWFYVPLGAPRIGLAHTWGIVLAARLILNQSMPPLSEDDQAHPFRYLLSRVLLLAVVLAMAWVAHLAMP